MLVSLSLLDSVSCTVNFSFPITKSYLKPLVDGKAPINVHNDEVADRDVGSVWVFGYIWLCECVCMYLLNAFTQLNSNKSNSNHDDDDTQTTSIISSNEQPCTSNTIYQISACVEL